MGGAGGEAGQAGAWEPDFVVTGRWAEPRSPREDAVGSLNESVGDRKPGPAAWASADTQVNGTERRTQKWSQRICPTDC